MAILLVFDPSDVHLQQALQKAVAAAIVPLQVQIASLTQKVGKLMSTLDDDIAAIQAQTTAIGSLSAFIQGLQAQIAAIPNITPAQQAQIDSIFSSVSANTAAITAAMAANVPPPPAPLPSPVPAA